MKEYKEYFMPIFRNPRASIDNLDELIMEVKEDIVETAKERMSTSGNIIEIDKRVDFYKLSISEYAETLGEHYVMLKHDYDVLESMLAMEKL